VGNVELVATPARHSSGRLPTRSGQTLWAGVALVGTAHRVWYSGDTGFHADLATIGERLGPFDVTLVEAGQYDASWPDSHLGPELAVEAHLLVRGHTLIPVHWALFKLAEHGWTEPAERVLVAARCRGVRVLTPRPGERIEPTSAPVSAPWWPALPWSNGPIVTTTDGTPAHRMVIPSCQP
jgi:L-ascorbate metabolism protein UlaG (beta-lactamase superfamily)